MRILGLVLVSLGFLSGCKKINYQANRLDQEPSPYLQLHATNPVWWQPWDKKVLDFAKEQDKLILLSVGYSTCHWCHVMEHEVFAHDDFAGVANANFISIKIDREQRPDLDAYFLKALQAITKRAGWPITLVLTPDLKPVFGATYVPKDKMVYILQELQKAWETQKDQLVERGRGVEDWMQKTPTSSVGFARDQKLVDQFYKALQKVYDPTYGGRRGQVKFPMNDDLRLLLRIHKRTGQAQALQMVSRTVNKMLMGGLFDHIGGGVFRYSTNPQWTLPHFEKMLYDQASFLLLLTELYQVQPSPLLEKSIRSMVDFLEREMTRPAGGFYAAIDADSGGKEGFFYTWKAGEIQSLLEGEVESSFLKDFRILGLEKTLHNRQIFTRRREESSSKTFDALKRLKTERDQRPRPLTDRKVITGWNGLVLSALARWAAVSGDDHLRSRIEKHLKFLLKNHLKRASLLFRYSLDKNVYGKGTADDYAFLIQALIQAYQLTFKDFYLRQALQLQQTMDRLFLDKKTGSYRFTRSKEEILKDLKIFQDGVRPSAQSVTFENLQLLGLYYYQSQLQENAQRLARQYPDILETYPLGFSRLLIGVDFQQSRPKELVIVGSLKECNSSRQEILKSFRPHLIFACAKKGRSQLPLTQGKTMKDGQSTFYLCSNGTCLAPTTDLKIVVQHLEDSSPKPK